MDDHRINRCADCPVPVGVCCRSDLFPAFCRWSQGGNPTHRQHIVNRSAIAEGGAVASPVRFDPMDCAWLGPATGATLDCVTCAGHVRLKVFACQLFETTYIRQCELCAERRPREG